MNSTLRLRKYFDFVCEKACYYPAEIITVCGRLCNALTKVLEHTAGGKNNDPTQGKALQRPSTVSLTEVLQHSKLLLMAVALLCSALLLIFSKHH